MAQASSLLGRQASCLSLSASLVSLDHASADPPDLRVMREHVDAPIAPAKERAHYPADDADNNRAPERAPKAGDLKTWHYLANEFQHQRINN